MPVRQEGGENVGPPLRPGLALGTLGADSMGREPGGRWDQVRCGTRRCILSTGSTVPRAGQGRRGYRGIESISVPSPLRH